MNTIRIVEEIKSGNLVVAPTDTVYGILADSSNLDAVKKVFECKHRGSGKALIVLVSDVEMLRKYVRSLSPLEEMIVQKYFPGKLTVLLHKNEKISDAVTCNSKFVGIRIPDDVTISNIVREVGCPLIATSANMSGQRVIVDPHKMSAELLCYISYVEDGGILDGGPSSIIKVVGEKIKVYREGEVVERMRLEIPEYF